MITYEQWNKAIISYFFEDHEDPDEIVFLQTNAETLSEIADTKLSDLDIVDAAASLTEVVREKVVFNDSVDFWLIDPTKISPQLNHSEGEPPQVAFLALAVLAASEMETRRYYEHLNELVFGDPDRGRWPQNELEDIEKFWKHLQEWAKDQRNIEFHLIQGPRNQRFVWYPKSQCLISKYDEHSLQVIFQAANLKPGAYLAESQLLDILRSSRYFQNLSVKITRPILEKRPAETRLILRQIQLLLVNWDGEGQERSQSGITKKRKSYSIDVQLKFNPFKAEYIERIHYWFRRKQNSQITFKPNSLNVESLQSDDGKWFEPFVVNVNTLSLQVLKNGIEIKSKETRPLTYQLKPSDIWVFRINSEPDDGWFSQGNFLLHERHHIIFRKEQSLRVTSILKHVCDPFTSPKSICVDDEETDWQYVEVKPIVLCNTPILGYYITTSDTISFVGGLPLDRRSNTYFGFCPPAVVFPNLIADSNEPFYMNGQAKEVPGDRKIEFGNKLDANEYRFSYLDQSIKKLIIISANRSTEHEKQTLAINLDPNAKKLPIFKDFKITEISEESDVWLAGAKFFGEDNIPRFVENDEDTSVLSAAELISSVVRVAIELKQENTSPPEWLYKAISNLNQNVALRALVEKKLNDYSETALSYHDLCSLGGD